MTEPLSELYQLERLLQSEHAFVREQQRLLFEESSLEARCKAGLTLYPLQLDESFFGLGGRLILRLSPTRPVSLEAFGPGQTVALWTEGEEPVHGVIQRRQSGQLRVYLNSSELSSGFESGKLGLDLYDDENTWREMFFALRRVCTTEDNHLQRLRDVLLGQQPARFLSHGRILSLPQLNPEQAASVQQVYQAQDVALIHGPPGTGKTTTLLACIRQILQEESQVLVCAPSNAAVDLLASRLAEQGQRVLRLGHPARLQERVWPLTVDAQLEQHPNADALRRLRKDMQGLRREIGRYRRQFGPAERAERQSQRAELKQLRSQLQSIESSMLSHILDQAQVIACTLVGSANKLLSGRRFQSVFIDEAAQALEGACWIPICKAERVILAGDHCQLPPTIHNPQAHALGITLFEKAIQRQGNASTRLLAQYRMHEAIMAFPNQWFYDGELRADSSVAHQGLDSHLPSSHALNQPMMWVDTAGCGFEEEQSDSKSWHNPGEIRLLKQILSEWFSDPDWPQTDLSIGVIAPYRRQVEALREALQGLNCPARTQLEIETVDSFQGQERDIICLSFVRSNEAGEIGFLRDLRRSNVAMTRARKKLLIIGDTATLGSHAFYQGLQAQVEAVGGYHSAWEWSGIIDF